MKMNEYRIGFIGFGHMMSLIFKAIDLAKLIPRSHCLFIRRDPKKMLQDEKEFCITSSSLAHLVKESHVLFLGVRPSQMEGLLKDLSHLGVQDKMLVSIAAGIPLSTYEKYLGHGVQIARVMPNLAVSVGEGMSVSAFSKSSLPEFRSVVQRIFGSMGILKEVAESSMDVLCAMVGSGPGFVLRLIDGMARFGEKEGLSYSESLEMTAQVFLGAARLVMKGGQSPYDLIHQIAVPQGTTEAGLKVMQESRMIEIFHEVLQAAAMRSRSFQ